MFHLMARVTGVTDNMAALRHYQDSTERKFNFQIYNTDEDRDEDYLRAKVHSAQNATTEWLATPYNKERENMFVNSQRNLSKVVGAYLTYHTNAQPNKPSGLVGPSSADTKLAMEVIVKTKGATKTYQTVIDAHSTALFEDSGIWREKTAAIQIAAEDTMKAGYLTVGAGTSLPDHLEAIIEREMKRHLGDNFDRLGRHEHSLQSETYEGKDGKAFSAKVVKGTVLPTKQEAFHNPLRLLKINADLSSFEDFNNYVSLQITELEGARDEFTINFYRFQEGCFQISHVGYFGEDDGMNSDAPAADIQAVDLTQQNSGLKITHTFAKLGPHRRHIDLLKIHAYLSRNDLDSFGKEGFISPRDEIRQEWMKAETNRLVTDNGYIFNYENNYTVIANSILLPAQTANTRATFYTIIRWSNNYVSPLRKPEINGLKQLYMSLSREVRQIAGIHPPSAIPTMDQKTEGYIATVYNGSQKGCFVVTDVNVFDYATLQARKGALEHSIVAKYYPEYKGGSIYTFISDYLQKNHQVTSVDFPGLFGFLLQKRDTLDAVREYTQQIKTTLDALKLKYAFVAFNNVNTDPVISRILENIELARARRKALKTTQHYMRPRYVPGRLPNPAQRPQADRYAFRGRGNWNRRTDSQPQARAAPALAGMCEMQAEIAELKRALNSTTLATQPASRL